MSSVFDYFSCEDEYSDFDNNGAVQRLSKAIACNTVNYADHSLTDFSGFDELQKHMKQSYPNVMNKGNFELLGHAVLITIEGTDSSLRPCLYMSHQDVVPVVSGTEKDWKYDAFSGAIAEDSIWGRGTLDIKNQVFAILEAAEYLLAHGKTFKRTAYLAFGDDEETLNTGALRIAETLRDRGVQLEFLVDEGGGKLESGAAFGAPNVQTASINLMEKGYADLELSVKSIGGHSSNPFGGTSLEHISQAISKVTSHPFKAKMPEPLKGAFSALKEYITEEPLRTLVQDISANEQAITEYCLTNRELFPYVTTTIAPTMINGGSAACNVMPQDMTAVINFRLNEGDSYESVLAHCIDAVADDTVSMRFLQANNPSATARTDGFGYSALVESMHHFYPDIVFIPTLTVGGTDAHQYEIICDTCLRCSPFISPAEDCTSGVHGTNEHITIRSYIQGIRATIRLMEKANIL